MHKSYGPKTNSGYWDIFRAVSSRDSIFGISITCLLECPHRKFDGDDRVCSVVTEYFFVITTFQKRFNINILNLVCSLHMR